MKLINLILPLFAVLISCSDATQKDHEIINTKKNIEVNQQSIINVESYSNIEIIERIPHDTNAYTQGLAYNNGFLYESTGQYGESTLRQINPNTGEIIRKLDLDDQYFAEGLTILNDKIYILTWMETVCFVYDLNTFTLLNQFRYKGQGWGLTNENKNLIFSNGTNNIFIFDDSFNFKYNLPAYNKNKPQYYLNELEYIDGLIFANVYQKDEIAVIDYVTGEVVSMIDASILRDEVYTQTNAEVLNGIAYDKTNNIFYLTGKNWKYIFKVKIN